MALWSTWDVLSETATLLAYRLAPRAAVGFLDAVSFVVVTTLLDNAPCLSFDRDFQALGLTVLQ